MRAVGTLDLERSSRVRHRRILDAASPHAATAAKDAKATRSPGPGIGRRAQLGYTVPVGVYFVWDMRLGNGRGCFHLHHEMLSPVPCQCALDSSRAAAPEDPCACHWACDSTLDRPSLNVTPGRPEAR